MNLKNRSRCDICKQKVYDYSIIENNQVVCRTCIKVLNNKIKENELKVFQDLLITILKDISKSSYKKFLLCEISLEEYHEILKINRTYNNIENTDNIKISLINENNRFSLFMNYYENDVPKRIHEKTIKKIIAYSYYDFLERMHDMFDLNLLNVFIQKTLIERV